tara:strand:- start:68774 stop:69556 length:783 start_codon:yes stop_codon:yes gene_type:complete
MLDRYTQTEFTHEGETKPVYVRGQGPAVIVIHEIPGITPNVVRFADWVVDAGFRVYMPLLVGQAGRDVTIPYVLKSMATICIRREFHVMASHRSSPVTDWLRGLARYAHEEAGGKGVGAVGMCFSGNFALSMMMEPALMAPVLSQPSFPFPLGDARKAALHVTPAELDNLKIRCAKGDKVLGLRFKGDKSSPPERFDTLRRELGDAFEGIEIEDKHRNPNSKTPSAHSVLTEDLIDKDGEPTKDAAKRVVDFFVERLLTP